MSTGRTIKLVQLARASQAALWRACATAEGLARWQADRVSGEIRRGHTITLMWPALHMELELHVRRVVEPELLVFDQEQNVVELRIEPGSVTVSQTGLPAEADVDGFASSWRIALSILAHAVEHYPERDRLIFWFVRRVRTTPESAYLLFTEPSGLNMWLGRTTGIGAAGSDYSVRLASGSKIEGRVLARVPGRDVAVSWPARRTALVFRTLPSPIPSERFVAITCSTWGGALLDTTFLSNAFERLVQALALGGSA